MSAATAKGVLVELSNGELQRKPVAQLQPNDMLVFDGPEFTEECQRMQADFEGEIAAAGGLKAWKLKNPQARTVAA